MFLYELYNQENKNKGDINNLVVNQLSEQLYEQFEKRIEDKDYTINFQKETIIILKETIIGFQKIIDKLG